MNLIHRRVNLFNNEEIPKTFKICFCNIAKNLPLLENLFIKEPSIELLADPVKPALEKYKDQV